MRFVAFFVLSVAWVSNSFGAIKCEKEVNSFTQLWGLGPVDRPTGNKITVGEKLILGKYNSEYFNGKVIDSNWTDDERKKRGRDVGGFWDGNAQITETKSGVRITRGGLIGNGRPPDISASLTYVEPLIIDLDSNCKLKKVTYHHRFRDLDQNGKLYFKEYKVELPERLCREIRKAYERGFSEEEIPREFEKIAGSEVYKDFQGVPELRWIMSPEESALQNCKPGFPFAKLLSPDSAQSSSSKSNRGGATKASP